ncbi:MAG: pyrroline-5-carboxylate reductase [Thermodesulfovibrionales bacterium]
MTGFVGGGNMAEALIKGMVREGGRDIIVSEPRPERRAHLEKAYGVRTTPDNREAVRASRVVVLAVKPQNMADVVQEIGPEVGEEKTVVSIAAGVTLSWLQERLATRKLVRAMPNVAALGQEGMTALSLCECFSDGDMGAVRQMFMSVGRVVVLPEGQMDAVTALSGSGPAFVALFVGAMSEAGAALGLRRDDALALAVQTARGTAKLLDEGLAPEKLVEMVRSPGGTTAEGLKVFEGRDLKGIVHEALEAAARRARELAR